MPLFLLSCLLCVLFLPVFTRSVMSAGSTTVTLPPFNASQVGLLDSDLAAPKLIPPACKQFDDICDIESSANYEQAFQMYEARYEACGDHGWSLDGHSSGEDSYVAFKTTPCGTRVVVKGSRRNATIQHIQRECEVLRSLSGDAEVAKSCAHCFPKYYYYSKTSRACYSEVIPNAGSTLIRAMKSRKPGALSVTKHVLLQGLTALRLLLKHNVEVSWATSGR